MNDLQVEITSFYDFWLFIAGEDFRNPQEVGDAHYTIRKTS